MDMAKLPDAIERSESGALNEYQSKLLLKAYGVPVVDEIAAADVAEAVDAARKTGFPVVLKGLGQTLLHKTEKHLVHLNLNTPETVAAAARAIAAEAGAALEGFLVQPQMQGRRELVAGLFRDELFGPVIMFGIGGILVEVVKDVVFRVLPISKLGARRMISEIKSASLLNGYRGSPPIDHSLIVELLLSVSEVVESYPEIQEIDLNPVIVRADGLSIVDARVILKKRPALARNSHE